MADKLQETRLNWIDTSKEENHIEKGIVIHYTPRWPLVVHFSCAIFCFAMSAIYHLFNSHSKKMMSFWIRFDYAGICLMIAGSSTPPIYYSFACEQLESWRFFYLGLLFTLGTITFLLMMIPYFDQDHL